MGPSAPEPNKRRAAKLRATFGRLLRRNDGATAVEFALIAAPFFALLFAMLQTALVFFAAQALETAVADSARLILTGQAQNGSFDQAKFKQSVCERVFALFDCSTGIKVDVRNYSAFASADLSRPVDANGNMTNNFVYQPGGPGDIVVVRLFYEWPVYVNLLGSTMSDMSGGKRLLTATAAFRNEPYK